MRKLKKFNKSEFKRQIKTKFGGIRGLKKHLKDTAKYEYDTWFSEVEVYGVKVAYTSNPNHFAKFFVQIPSVGFQQTLALGKSSITPAGRRRGAGGHYLAL